MRTERTFSIELHRPRRSAPDPLAQRAFRQTTTVPASTYLPTVPPTPTTETTASPTAAVHGAAAPTGIHGTSYNDIDGSDYVSSSFADEPSGGTSEPTVCGYSPAERTDERRNDRDHRDPVGMARRPSYARVTHSRPKCHPGRIKHPAKWSRYCGPKKDKHHVEFTTKHTRTACPETDFADVGFELDEHGKLPPTTLGKIEKHAAYRPWKRHRVT